MEEEIAQREIEQEGGAGEGEGAVRGGEFDLRRLASIHRVCRDGAQEGDCRGDAGLEFVESVFGIGHRGRLHPGEPCGGGFGGVACALDLGGEGGHVFVELCL